MRNKTIVLDSGRPCHMVIMLFIYGILAITITPLLLAAMIGVIAEAVTAKADEFLGWIDEHLP